MNFNRLKEATAKVIREENADNNKLQNVLNIFKRFKTERDFIKDRVDKLKINKAAKPQMDENKGFVFKIIYTLDMDRQPEPYRMLFQTNGFWYAIMNRALIRICKYSKIEIYDDNSDTLISNSVFIPGDSVILSDEELKLLRKPFDKKALNPWTPYYDSDLEDHMKNLISEACIDCEIIGTDTKAYTDENCNYVEILSAYTKDSEADRRYLAEKELRNLLNIDTGNQFIKNYHKQVIEAIETIDISETIENLLCEAMSKKNYSHDDCLHLHFSLTGDPTRQTISIENGDIVIRANIDAGITVELENESATLYKFPNKSELTILTANVPDIISSGPDITKLLSNHSLNIKTKYLIHDDIYYDDWYDKIFSIIDKQIENSGLTIDEKHIIPIEDYDDPQYYKYIVTVKNPVYNQK